MPVLRRMHHHTGSAVAVALDVDAWASSGPTDGGATPVLAQQGWRAVPLGPRDRLETAWQELARREHARPGPDGLAMRRATTRLTGALLTSVVAAATTWVSMLSWRGFTADPADFLRPLLLLAAVVALTGAIARWRRLPGAVVFALRLVLSGRDGMLDPHRVTTAGRAGVRRAHRRLRRRREQRQPLRAPGAGRGAPVDPFLISGGLACLLLVDLLACTLQRVPLAGLPLLAVYTVPVSMLDGGLAWWIFALSAAGFLALLFLHENEQIAEISTSRPARCRQRAGEPGERAPPQGAGEQVDEEQAGQALEQVDQGAGTRAQQQLFQRRRPAR